MGQFAWSEQVTTLSTMLDTLEAKVGDGDLGTPGLEELKSGLDTLRLRTWSLLTAFNSEDPQGFQQRFRTRRGEEMCRALSTDVRAGRLSGRQSELPSLGAAARELATAVKDVTRKPAKRRGKKAV
jgi:hypothetical protein